MFVSSHLISEMALVAEHLVVIGRGRLLADTSVAELTARRGSLEEAFFELTGESAEYRGSGPDGYRGAPPPMPRTGRCCWPRRQRCSARWRSPSERPPAAHAVIGYLPISIVANSLGAVKPMAEGQVHLLSPWAGLGMLCLYAAVTLGIGGWLLARRDA